MPEAAGNNISVTPEIRNWDENPVLTVEHLTMRFGGLIAINDLSFNVGRGDITALIGPNGAGKTTVFNCVTGFYKPTEGRIVMRHGPGFQHETVDQVTNSGLQWKASDNGAVFLLERMPDFQISQNAKVARTFQNIRLFGGMTVLENLLVAQHNPLMHASRMTVGGILGLPGYKHAEEQAIDRAVDWLKQVNLIDRADDPAADLPYGAQRRLEIARAMCTGPELLCLDEPAAGLNPRESAELNELLQFIRSERNTSVLLIEHDMGVVMEISDHIVVLDYGVKISDGDASFVKSDPQVIAAYLGIEDEEEIDDPVILQDILAVKKDTAAIGTKPKKPASKARTAKQAATKAGTAAAKAKPAATRSRTASVAKPKKAAGAKTETQPATLKKPRAGGADNLTRIKGIGPQIEKKLNGFGIWHFDQIAAWKKRDVDWFGSQLSFQKRIGREEWVKQARILARGGATEFAKRVDSDKVPSSRAGRARPARKGSKT